MCCLGKPRLAALSKCPPTGNLNKTMLHNLHHVTGEANLVDVMSPRGENVKVA